MTMRFFEVKLRFDARARGVVSKMSDDVKVNRGEDKGERGVSSLEGLQEGPTVRAGVDSKMLRAGKRTYFFDVKEDRRGTRYLVITESRFLGETGGRMRNSVMVYPEDIEEFEKYFKAAIGELKSGSR